MHRHNKLRIFPDPEEPATIYFDYVDVSDRDNPLITEYEGNDWDDYPDPNYDPNKVDSEEKNTKDPRFAGPPNTITK